VSIETLLARASEGINAGRAFGPPVERDGCTIIPVAYVFGGGGGGDASMETGGSSGGGFGSVAWPLGVYVIKDGYVRWVPAIDWTLLGLGGLVVARTVLRIRTRHRRRRARMS
jgi:uncharacterized spore protein YtfJ